MSNFNEANDLAAQLCWGRTYMGDCPMKLDRIVLRKTNKVFREEVIITIPHKVPTSQAIWAEVASYLHQLMHAIKIDGQAQPQKLLDLRKGIAFGCLQNIADVLDGGSLPEELAQLLLHKPN
jgi:hypothetical protein